MDLLDRYLGAVAALLPAAQRQDIVAELRDLLESRIDDKAAELGRPLSKAEMEALLNGFGHPLAVAGRYGPQRALIGVELYPYWLFALKAALAVAAFVSLIPALVQMATTDWDVSRAFSHALAGFLPFALQLVGVITLIGAAVERGWIKTGDFGQWRVSDLPPVRPKRGWFPPPTRFEALFELVACGVFILWWVGLVEFPVAEMALTRHDGVTMTVGTIFSQLHLPILLLAVGQVVSSLIIVLRPAWIAPRAVAEIVLAIGGLILAGLLWRAMPWLTFSGPDGQTEALARLQAWLDLTLKVTLVVAASVNAGKILIEGWRLVRAARG
ncbi:hypothetical protein [Caulobacter sp. HMWF025]|uniref:hypothetical protein n=1 Tax=Caulobacter sp. HMWF025 TaxID=2056860 RepID=UPI000D37E779|nr:hypothetical protein [Caulobacter sp. HMWF025]PTT07333.1 hypothetical protein DBR10_10510 [Caulobacter sp. HMWF025]